MTEATRFDSSAVVQLGELRSSDREMVGAKAANLGELAQAGFPVPDGFVVVGEPADQAVLAATRALGAETLAVRSSSVAEDRADASFAGQYETVLNVRGDDGLLGAIQQVRESASTARAQSYHAAAADTGANCMAVLVQRMLTPDAAGVAFTADPVTGERGVVLITAARGLGERVVSGEAIGDEWEVRSGEVICRREREGAIDSESAVSIASLARRAEECFGTPQDIEWAVAEGKVYLLQARPMTALPEPADWTPPSAGFWMRNFRLGEWLPEPMTPLFEDWLLERIEAGYLVGMRRTAGAGVPFRHAAVNGWYYTSAPTPGSVPRLLLPALLQSRGKVLWVVYNALVRVSTDPVGADHALLGRLAAGWRRELLPRYQRSVAEAETAVESATPEQLESIVDAIGGLAGEYLWSMAIVGGSAWKMEGALARFLRRYVAQAEFGGVQVLLRGLTQEDLTPPGHAVQSVDWYWPTAGELGSRHAIENLGDRRRELVAQRTSAEAACRQALRGDASTLGKFERLLEVAQRYALLREEQARWFTLAWPLLRRCGLRLGDAIRECGRIERAEDVFFLTRAELRGQAAASEVVRQRRAEWERRRRLLAPLTLGTAPRLMEASLAGVVNAVREPRVLPEGSIVGQPASPGRATGPVRIVRGPEDFDRFEAGEVLVAQATAPAWTPLFGRAAAVVTDGGTLAAHASLVAREYGIPAVVGTGDATRRLRDGQVVLVDGSAGLVEVVGAGRDRGQPK